MNIADGLIFAQEASFFSGLDANHRAMIMVMSLGFVFLLTLILGAVLLSAWSSAKEKRIDFEFKRDMLERGMTVDEIERLIAAGSQNAVPLPAEESKS